MDNISDRLKVLVNELAGGKYTVFAAKAGIPHSTFQNYIHGRTPHVDHLLRIHDKFQVSMDWLLAGIGEPFLNDEDTKGGESGSRPLNPEILTLIIKTLDSKLQERGLGLPPDKKAQVITLLYEYYLDTEKEVDEKRIADYLRLVS